MEDPKPIYKSKTLVFNVLAIIVLIANGFGFADFELTDDVIAFVTMIVNFILRLYTDRPIAVPEISFEKK